ncbi:MAG: acyltransferase [Deltaproteobacteria bacterium]|nr:acyltransferase [Deltaproteobacteria bacterium]
MSTFYRNILYFFTHRHVEFGAKIRGKVSLGREVSLKSGCEIDSDTKGSITIDDFSCIHRDSLIISYGGDIFIGKYTTVNPFCVLYGHGGLKIGNNCLIATGCVMIPANHLFASIDIPIDQQGVSKRGITIEDDVWLGAHVIVLDGVTIGKGSVIGAGAVVSNNIPPYSVAVGVPARPIKNRTDINNE